MYGQKYGINILILAPQRDFVEHIKRCRCLRYSYIEGKEGAYKDLDATKKVI